MTALLIVPVTTAVTAQLGPTLQVRSRNAPTPINLVLQGTLTYTSGGTTSKAWVQTSLDGGTNWFDVANFSFTTAAAVKVFNLNCVPVNTVVTQLSTFTDGTLTADTAFATPFFGNLWRVKYTTTGTYVGTVLRVDANFAGELTTL